MRLFILILFNALFIIINTTSVSSMERDEEETKKTDSVVAQKKRKREKSNEEQETSNEERVCKNKKWKSFLQPAKDQFLNQDDNEKQKGREALFHVIDNIENFFILFLFSQEDEGVKKNFIKEAEIHFDVMSYLLENGTNDDRKRVKSILKTYADCGIRQNGDPFNINKLWIREETLRIISHNCQQSLYKYLSAKNIRYLLIEGGKKCIYDALSPMCLYQGHPDQFFAALLLFYSEDKESQDIGLEGMKSMLQQLNHPDRFAAAARLRQIGSEYSEDGKNVLIEISRRRGHPDQQRAKQELEMIYTFRDALHAFPRHFWRVLEISFPPLKLIALFWRYWRG